MKRVVISLCLLAYVVTCLCSCGKTAEISDIASSVKLSDYEEISFVVTLANPDAVTYTVCSSKEDFLFYEGHLFAYVEQYSNGWYPLVMQEITSTGNLQCKSIPTSEMRETMSMKRFYGGKLEKGRYRLVAPCYTSQQNLYEFQGPVYIAAEFEIT